MRKAFESYIIQQQLLNPADKILVAFSGGPDSVALAQLLLELKYKIGIAHVNYGLRGTESDEDEAFVRKFAKKHHLTCYIHAVLTKEYAEKQKMSVQMAARELRYDWFTRLAKEKNFDRIALGHHADDQVETFFINLFRGSGLKGLKAMKPKSGKLIRPLLFADRETIMEYLHQHGHHYREDSSNKSQAYKRNQIRHALIPALQNIDAQPLTGIKQSIKLLAQNNALYQELVENVREKLMIKQDSSLFIDTEKLLAFHARETLLFELLHPYGFDARLIAAIGKALHATPGKVFYAPQYQLHINRNQLALHPIEDQMNIHALYVYEDGVYEDEHGKLQFETFIHNENFQIDPSPHLAYLDKDKLQYPLCIRGWQQGDRFFPLGMNQSKLLSDFFIDEKRSQHQKERTRLLCSANGDIVWIIGQRIDHRYRLTDQSQNILCIKAIQPDPETS